MTVFMVGGDSSSSNSIGSNMIHEFGATHNTFGSESSLLQYMPSVEQVLVATSFLVWSIVSFLSILGTLVAVFLYSRHTPLKHIQPSSPSSVSDKLSSVAQTATCMTSAREHLPSDNHDDTSTSATTAATATASATTTAAAPQLPGVTIIRPLKGIDPALRSNLASSFMLDYPGPIEILLAVADASDPAAPVARELLSEFPNVNARLMVGERVIGSNPKICNMINAYEQASHDLVWICDSNVSVDSGCLSRSVDLFLESETAEWKQSGKYGLGIVHHLPFGVNGLGFGAEMEGAFLGTMHAKIYLALNFLAPDSCVVGKSNMYRKSVMAHFGGLAALADIPSEDNTIGQMLWRLPKALGGPLRHAVTSDLAIQTLGSMSVSDYLLRRARWTRIRKVNVTAATVVEPVTETIMCGLVASYGFYKVFGVHPLGFALLHYLLSFLLDYTLHQTLRAHWLRHSMVATSKVVNPLHIDDTASESEQSPSSSLLLPMKYTLVVPAATSSSVYSTTTAETRAFIVAWLFREITALPLFIYAVAGNTIIWRGRHYKLLWNGTAKPVDDEPRPTTTTAASTAASTASTASTTNDGHGDQQWPMAVPAQDRFLNAAARLYETTANFNGVTGATVDLESALRHPVVAYPSRFVLWLAHLFGDVIVMSQRNGNREDVAFGSTQSPRQSLSLDEQPSSTTTALSS